MKKGSDIGQKRKNILSWRRKVLPDLIKIPVVLEIKY
jgi:hypothetical protein